MKTVTQDGKIYELYKRELEIVRVVRHGDGSREFVDKVRFDDASVCNYDWNSIKGEIVDQEHPWAILSRSEAQDLKLNKYYTGRTCRRGHESQRYTTTGLCIACVAARAKKFSKAARGAPDGMMLFEAYVHPGDLETLREVAEGLKQTRALQGVI